MAEMRKTVLFVDDDVDVRKAGELVLRRAGYQVFGAADPSEALSRLVANPVDVILLDLNFSRLQTSGAEGLAALRDILRQDPNAVVVVETGHSGLTIAVEALRAGARDFLMKPWNNARLIEAIENALAVSTPSEMTRDVPPVLVGNSETMVRVKATLDRCAPLTASVIVRGEPGTGKTLAASSLHRQSGRMSLVQVEADGLTMEHLADAPNTTLLLENVERLQPAQSGALQTWIARAPRQNSRIVSTTTILSRDLGLDRGLTYAISVMDIELPALRSRENDVALLANHFMRITCHQHGFGLKTLSTAACADLVAFPWPDNVHTLRHTIERTVILSQGAVINSEDLALPFDNSQPERMQKPKLADVEKIQIEDALQRNNFNVSAAAAELGLTRPALYRRMSKYGL